MNIRHLTIGTRLTLAFSGIIAAMLALSLLGGLRLNTLADNMQDITEVNDPESALAVKMRVTVSSRMISLRNVVLLDDLAQMQSEADGIATLATQYAHSEEELRTLLSTHGASHEEHAALDEASAAARDAAPLVKSALDAALAGRKAEAIQVLITRLRPVQQRWSKALTHLGEIEAADNVQLLALAHSLQHSTNMMMAGLAVLAALLGAVLAWRITRSITLPLAQAVALARTVADGDLSGITKVAGRDEPAKLMHALNDMTASLRQVVGTVSAGAEAIKLASAEVAAGTLDLSSRTESQAGTLEETASSMEQLTSAVQHNADNAAQADKLADEAAKVAARSGAVVRQMVDTMSGIDDASRRIADIIGVIDSITFQTNILALNAAVEAARAGEQGRGFAVVASEVRNLAQRSATAAKEIKGLVGESMQRVAAGTALAGEAGTTMQNVVASIARVSTLMAEISRASSEQSTGIGQVNEAITSIDSTTQQNAALVEQTSAAAASLQQEASQLTSEVARFQLDATHIPAPARTPARPLRHPRAPVALISRRV